jgi:hypothetical protein
MSTASSYTSSHKTDDASSSKLVRRREKRRHVNSTALDLRDPFEIIALAIRYDESQPQAEEILRTPIESGSIYNQRLFAKALAHLQRMTTPPVRTVTTESATTTASVSSSSRSRTKPKRPQQIVHNNIKDNNKSDTFYDTTHNITQASLSVYSREVGLQQEQDPGQQQQEQQEQSQQPQLTALTPIILSGLLTSLDDPKNPRSSSNHNNDSSTSPPTAAATTTTTVVATTSTELVNYCQQMRRAALARVRLRQERLRIQRIVTPLLLCTVGLGFYFYIMSNLNLVMLEYGFLDSCEMYHHYNPNKGIDNVKTVTVDERYVMACRHAEAVAWEKLNQAHSLQFLVGAGDHHFCTVDACSLADTLDEIVPLYSMHLPLQDAIVPLEDVLGRQRRQTRRKQSQRGISPVTSNGDTGDSSFGLPVQWLGDTVVNRLVREAIVALHQPPTGSRSDSVGNLFSILDIGSGLSGTLFSFLTSEFPFPKWTYHGISISQPETRRASQLVHAHKIFSMTRGENDDAGASSSSSSPSLVNVTIQQESFDAPLPSKAFHSMIAIESLTYSRNLTVTLQNLVSGLTSKGSLIVVDDVVAPWANPDRIQHLINRTAKASLITHQEWLNHFSAAGLVLQQRPRDLILEYEFDWFTTFEPEKPGYIFFQNLLQRWPGRDSPTRTNKASVRALHLLQDLIQQARGDHWRREAYHTADLTYMIYVCRKR